MGKEIHQQAQLHKELLHKELLHKGQLHNAALISSDNHLRQESHSLLDNNNNNSNSNKVGLFSVKFIIF